MLLYRSPYDNMWRCSKLFLIIKFVFILCLTPARTLLNKNFDFLNDSQYLSSSGKAPPFINYKPLGYANITDEIWKIDRSGTCSDILYVTTAQRLYQNRQGVNIDPDFFKCGDRRCETMIVRLATKSTLRSTTPEIFLSGVLHGDERLGPVVLFEFIRLLCQMYGKNPILTYLMQTRSIWMTPMTNAWGYAHGIREENGVDPNRDFPYDRDPKHCFESVTARVLNELFLDHLFQISLTFHGGTRLISYEWGSKLHMKRQERNELIPVASTEAPDLTLEEDIASLFQIASGWLDKNHTFPRHEDYGYRRQLSSNRALCGNTTEQEQQQQIRKFHEKKRILSVQSDPWKSIEDGPGAGWFYPIGSMTNLVYPVNGGFEDWSYSGSWEGSPHPITICKPDTNGGYTSERSFQNLTDSLRTATFLVEADYFKNPPASHYGNSTQIANPSGADGHIPRNLRLVLKTAELVVPDVLLLSSPTLTNNHLGQAHINLSFLPIGCVEINSLDLLILNGKCPKSTLTQSTNVQTAIGKVIPLLHQSRNCSGIGLWEEWGKNLDSLKWHSSSNRHKGVIQAQVPLNEIPENACLKVRGVFDQRWAKQKSPDPYLPPQTHLARTRLLNSYFAQAGSQIIQSTRKKLFPQNNSWGLDWRNGISIVSHQIQRESQDEFADHIKNNVSINLSYITLPNNKLNEAKPNERHHWKITFFYDDNEWQQSDGVKLASSNGVDDLDSFVQLAGLDTREALPMVTERDWDPFQMSMRIKSSKQLSHNPNPTAHTNMWGQRLLQHVSMAKGSIVGILAETFSSNLMALNNPVQFTLRAWNSTEPIALKKPRRKGELVTNAISISKDEFDGELLRWTVDKQGKVVSALSQIGLAMNITDANSIDVSSLTRLYFTASSNSTALTKIGTLFNKVLSLEANALSTNTSEKDFVEKESELLSISTQVLTDPIQPNESLTSLPLICIFDKGSLLAITANKKMIGNWINTPEYLQSEFEKDSYGYVHISRSASNGQRVTGKLCHLEGVTDTSYNLIAVEAASQCVWNPLVARWPSANSTSLLRQGSATIDVNNEFSSASNCTTHDTLKLTLLTSVNIEKTVAMCTLRATRMSSNDYGRSYCSSKMEKTSFIKTQAEQSLSQQRTVIAGLIIGFFLCAIMPIAIVINANVLSRSQKRPGYARVDLMQVTPLPYQHNEM